MEDLSPFDYDWYGYQPGLIPRSDAEIRADIKDQLAWSPFVDAERIIVTVEDGVATLTGSVVSWAAMDAATENAFEGGATWVRNRLEVEPGEE